MIDTVSILSIRTLYIGTAQTLLPRHSVLGISPPSKYNYEYEFHIQRDVLVVLGTR